jgi:PAS domain-containing protein
VPETFFESDPKTMQFRREMAQFFDATTDAIVFLDRNYQFTFANRRANELISEGRSLVGDNLFDRFPGVV